MSRVGIVGHTGRPAVRRAAAQLASRLGRRGHDVRIDEALALEMGESGLALSRLAAWCRVMVSLGGDGTVLHAARAMAGRRGAVLPINLGGLGFLTTAEQPELEEAVRGALGGAWPVARRRLVVAEVRRGGRRRHRALAVNDAVVKTSGGYSALHLRMRALGSDLGHLVSDGVIAASAAGSTAYSLSAGGPLLAPDLEALVVTPVCPHTLASRALVLSPREALELKVIGSLDQAILLLDGQDNVALEAGDEVVVTLGRTHVRMFQNPARPFARALQSKLGWQGSLRRSL